MINLHHNPVALHLTGLLPKLHHDAQMMQWNINEKQKKMIQ